MIFLTMMLLLPAMVQTQHPEVSLINRLNEFFDFDHNLFFLDTVIDENLHIPCMDNAARSFTPQTIHVFDKNHNDYVNEIQLAKVTAISGKTFLIVVVEASQFENYSPWFDRVYAIRMLNVDVKIGVFFKGNIMSGDVVELLFRWSWSVGIANIFCAFYTSTDSGESFHAFRFDPFGSFDLINLTGSESAQDYFIGNVPNYRRHHLRMITFESKEYSMYEVSFWVEIRMAFNARLSLIDVDLGDPEKNVLGADDYDFIMYASRDSRSGTRQPLHPSKIITKVLLVPHAKQRSGIMGYIQNAKWKQIFILTIMTIAIASILLTINGYLRTKEVFFLQNVVNIVNLLMNNNEVINYGRLSRADVWVMVPFTFAGLIVMSGILSVFQSYLTLPLYERQINSLDGLFQSTVPIIDRDDRLWTGDEEKLLEDVSGHGGWNEKIHQISGWEDEVDKFNDSVAFFMYDYQARPFLDVQKQLGIKAYHQMTGVSLQTAFVSFQISDCFPFVERMNEIIHRLQSAGLLNRWSSIESYLQTRYIREQNLQFQLNTKDEEKSNASLILLFFGWISSTVLFVCEIIWNKFKTRILRSKSKVSHFINRKFKSTRNENRPTEAW